MNPLTLLGSLQVKLIAVAVALALAGTGGFYGGYRWEHGALVKVQLADAQASLVASQRAAASQKRQDDVSLAAAVKEQAAQDALNIKVITIRKEIPVYVSPVQDARSRTGCGISVGFIRVLHAAAKGVAPDTLQLATGQSDDDCADIAPSALADLLAQALGAGNANAEQLNALEDWVRDNHKAQVNQ